MTAIMPPAFQYNMYNIDHCELFNYLFYLDKTLAGKGGGPTISSRVPTQIRTYYSFEDFNVSIN